MAYVFVVDDDPAIRTALRSALEEHGHVVFEAGDGVSALERLRASPWPLVVLLDFKLPAWTARGCSGQWRVIARSRSAIATC